MDFFFIVYSIFGFWLMLGQFDSAPPHKPKSNNFFIGF